MAREPQDREDLLAEASGLPVRGALRLPDDWEVVVGFRDDGSASWFFAADPVFQFDPQFQLRRAYCDGIRYAVAGGQIVRLEQLASTGRIHLTKHPLDRQQSDQLLDRWKQNIHQVRTAFENKTHRWEGASVPIDAFEHKVMQWISDVPSPPPIAKVSRLPRRRSS
ncbi:hypothetical protein Poly24_15090 [Rosistilla carotiformis]|uniref:Uncharacterized protein n=1 Tax=Rosistilla carotiformis TaxID=2528017 RepID=A0A518JQJ3_9BACT|nr:hypothetical protein [Rosistilla carotiformis]QDV67805.1 hypothetical protein Poly24_15090 [Rosistilla carotiformis]